MDENTILFWILGVPMVIFLFALAFREGLFNRSEGNVSEYESLPRQNVMNDQAEQFEAKREKVRGELMPKILPEIKDLQERAIEDPKDSQLRLQLGHLYFSIWDFEHAKEHYESVLVDGLPDQKLTGLTHLLYACSVLGQGKMENPNSTKLEYYFEAPTVDVINSFGSEGLAGVVREVANEIWLKYATPLASFHGQEAVRAFESVIKSAPTDLEVLRILREMYSFRGKRGRKDVGRIDSLIMKAETIVRRSRASEMPSARPESTVEKGVTFERRCVRLLVAMGYSVSHTGQSGDGGVDIRANDPTPIKGGSIIVQCKDWQNTIGEPTLRDLYGLVISEGAGKGVIIASSEFTHAAIDFAIGKPLELIDGRKLEALEQQYAQPNS